MLLSRTYRPSPEMAPYVRRFYVFEADLPDELVIEDFLLSETAFIRVLIKGDWAGEIAPQVWSRPGRSLFFGANGLPFKVRVKGSFCVAGAALRPSGWRALFHASHQDYADRLMRLDEVWHSPTDMLEAAMDNAGTDEDKIAALEQTVRARLDRIGRHKVDDKLARFEVIARTDSTRRVEDIADELGLSMRQFARRCLTGFGLTPKAILRRSRFLDMATAMRGFSSPSEQDLAALRYYDQSHLGREFKRFTSMTPSVFAHAVTPLQTAGLKLREESKYED
ncbi:MAG: helix-turn-helix domain-containing protein [Sphingomonadaceae bacterium]